LVDKFGKNGTISPQDGEGDNDTTVIFLPIWTIRDFILRDWVGRRVDKCPDICLFFSM
jgi:hypothetical protein